MSTNLQADFLSLSSNLTFITNPRGIIKNATSAKIICGEIRGKGLFAFRGIVFADSVGYLCGPAPVGILACDLRAPGDRSCTIIIKR